MCRFQYTQNMASLSPESSGSTPTPFGFAGQHGYQSDSETGLMRLGYRYYDASTGRFIGRDPIEAGENWYGYCENDPVNGVDPQGLNTIAVGGGNVKMILIVLGNQGVCNSIKLRDILGTVSKWCPGIHWLLTGYFDAQGDLSPIGLTMSRLCRRIRGQPGLQVTTDELSILSDHFDWLEEAIVVGCRDAENLPGEYQERVTHGLLNKSDIVLSIVDGIDWYCYLPQELNSHFTKTFEDCILDTRDADTENLPDAR